MRMSQRWGSLGLLCQHAQAGPPRSIDCLREPDQIVIRRHKDRAAQHVRERQIGLRCHQEVQQRTQIQRFERCQQAAPARAHIRHTAIAQRAFIVGQIALAANKQLEIAPPHGAFDAVLADALSGVQCA